MEQRNGRVALRIDVAGLLTTVQDLGRYGVARFGLPVSGALDDCALRWANLLVGNGPDAAALEMTLAGPTLTLEGATPVLCSLTGADCGATLAGRAMPPWRSFLWRPGETLALGACRTGMRAYLALAGGIAVPPTFGSRSTDTLGGIGGGSGRALQSGDALPLDPPPYRVDVHRALPRDLIPQYPHDIEVRVVLGTQEERFTEEAVARFLAGEFRVTPETDRMGMRLEGPPLAFRAGASGADILSEGVVTGAIQVPAHGQPIVLLAGHQTTGGYAKIATVIGADLWRLGQTRPGDRIRFHTVALAEAHAARRLYLAGFERDRLIPLTAEECEPSASMARGTGATGVAERSGAVVETFVVDEEGDREQPASTAWRSSQFQEFLDHLLDRFAALGLDEMHVETASLRLHLRRGAAPAAGEAAGPQEAAPASFSVTAPTLGIFHRRARPDAPPFVEVGERVSAGQVLGLVEVMKTFQEVSAPRAGRVAAVLVADGAAVEYGQPLFTLEALDGAGSAVHHP